MRILAFAAGCLLVGVACHSSDSSSESDTARLLRSTDRVAVYDAGVKAYRAKTYPQARRFWQRAAQLGDHDAESNLGFLFYYGLGGAADAVAASAFWKQAMAHGNPEAHRHVAQAILDGDLRLGRIEAPYGHARAAEQIASRPGDLDGRAVARDADELARRIRPRLSSQQLASGERLGVKWSTSSVKH